MPRLIWVFAGRTAILLVLSLGGSNVLNLPLILLGLKSTAVFCWIHTGYGMKSSANFRWIYISYIVSAHWTVALWPLHVTIKITKVRVYVAWVPIWSFLPLLHFWYFIFQKGPRLGYAIPKYLKCTNIIIDSVHWQNFQLHRFWIVVAW